MPTRRKIIVSLEGSLFKVWPDRLRLLLSRLTEDAPKEVPFPGITANLLEEEAGARFAGNVRCHLSDLDRDSAAALEDDLLEDWHVNRFTSES